MKNFIALVLVAALALSLCGCCCCLSLPTADKTSEPTKATQSADTTRPTEDSPTYPTEGRPEDNTTAPTDPMPTEGTPVEPPVEKPEDDRVTAYKTTKVQVTVYDEGGTVINKVITPHYGETYNLQQIQCTKDGCRYIQATFDGSLDKPLLKEWYSPEGYRESYEEHVYYDNGLLWYVDSGSDATGDFTVDVYTYNLDNQVTSFKRYYGENLETETTYYYHEDGWLSYTVDQDYNEGIAYRTAYNAYGHVVERYFDFGSGYTDGRNYQNTYVDDVLVESVGYYEGEIETIVKYDSQGREYQYQYFYEGEEYDRTETTYNGDELVSYKYYLQGELYYRYNYSYDHNGNITEFYTWDSNDGGTSWQYNYDGNQLISIRCYSNGTLRATYTFDMEAVTVDQKTADDLAAITKHIIDNL